jgi:glycosyltransferase involved in cell wall biosynthesis
MKILFDHHTPFSLAHGGFQHQLAQTKSALDRAGVETDYVRWWDSSQSGDIIQFFGRPTAGYIGFAHGSGFKVIIAELLAGPGSRSPAHLALHKYSANLLPKILPRNFTARMGWDAYRVADGCIALTPWEGHLMTYIFGAPPDRVHVVGNGVEDIFLDSKPASRGKWLVCTATIVYYKRALELAEAAVRAQTPVWIIGKAYDEADAYAQRFYALSKAHPQIIRYEGAISDRARLSQIYREARGFVLLSAMESLSLSALEAAACECPLLLSDLPWARGPFGDNASYCPVSGPDRTAEFLKKFYEVAPTLPVPPKPASWDDIARQLKSVYERLL